MLPFAFKQSTHRRLPSARKRSDSQACEFKFRLPQVASSALSSTLHSHFLTLNGRGTTCWEIALVKSASCQLDEKRPTRRSATPDFPEVWIWEVCFRQSLGFLPSGGQYTSKAPGSRYLGRARLARPAPCPAICGIEKDDGRIKRLCR